jgi:hypothetical protein
VRDNRIVLLFDNRGRDFVRVGSRSPELSPVTGLFREATGVKTEIPNTSQRGVFVESFIELFFMESLILAQDERWRRA